MSFSKCTGRDFRPWRGEELGKCSFPQTTKQNCQNQPFQGSGKLTKGKQNEKCLLMRWILRAVWVCGDLAWGCSYSHPTPCSNGNGVLPGWSWLWSWLWKATTYWQIEELICTKEQKVPPSNVVSKSGTYAKTCTGGAHHLRLGF